MDLIRDLKRESAQSAPDLLCDLYWIFVGFDGDNIYIYHY